VLLSRASAADVAGDPDLTESDAMTEIMSTEKRTEVYLKQSGRKELTPRQRRRVRKKENKARGGK